MSQEEKKDNKISRRQFLKRSAAAGTGVALGSLVSKGPASAASGPSIPFTKNWAE